MQVSHRRRSPETTWLIMLLLVPALPVLAQFDVQTVPASEWGASDESVGLAGAMVEDFEDLALVAGLTLELADANGDFTLGPQTTLSAVFDPVNGDPFGDAFASSVWDGNNVLLNIPGNGPVDYGSRDFRAVRIGVPGGALKVAMALHQVTGNNGLIVNGVTLGRLLGLGFPVGPDRNGLLIITALDENDPITSVAFGGGDDAFCVDHVAFLGHTVAVAGTTWGALKAVYRE